MRAIHWRTVLVFLATVGPAAGLHAQDFSKIEVRTIPVADNLYVLAGGGGSIVLSTGNDGALLVDAGYEQQGAKIVAAVSAVSKTPIRLVINTHWHFDHVGGNEYLDKQGVVIIAHRNVRKRMSEAQYISVIDKRVEASPLAALPRITFADSLTLDWNGEEVQVLHVDSAHTDGDSLVYFRKANLLHVGDTWFKGMYPFIDVNAGGSLDGLVKALNLALELADEKTKIVPGHGPLSSKAELRVYRDMLATARDRVRALTQQGKSREEILMAKPTEEFDQQWGRSWLDPDTWVGLVYDGMMRQTPPADGS